MKRLLLIIGLTIAVLVTWLITGSPAASAYSVESALRRFNDHPFGNNTVQLWQKGTVIELEGGMVIYSPYPWYYHYCELKESGYDELYWKCPLDRRGKDNIYLFTDDYPTRYDLFK